MNRLLLTGCLLAFLCAGSGCAMCAHPWDYAYGAYGGKFQRGDQFHGRVNSAFCPAGGENGEYGGEYVDGETVIEPHDGSLHIMHEADLEPPAEMTRRR